MRSPIARCSVPGFRPAATSLLVASVLVLALTACKSRDEPGAHVAGWTLIDPSQKHPIMVSQQPATMSLRVARGSQGLSATQKSQVAGFLERHRVADAGNSKLVITVPSGSANETAAMHVVGGLRRMVSDYGYSDSDVVMEPYGSREANAPIHLSYLRYVAEGPECPRWTHNLAEDKRNLPYSNLGCAQQHNLAAQVANPADLLGPRVMAPADQERRAVVFDRYRQGRPTLSDRHADERVQVKGN
jgi:pilus assembly protein CpaD